MFTESRKNQLIEDVIKTNNEEILFELEAVLKKTKKKTHSKKENVTIYDFLGILTKKEGKEMRKAIEETCETINPDDWK